MNPTEAAATQLRQVVGFEATNLETPLVVAAIRLAWEQVVAEKVGKP